MSRERQPREPEQSRVMVVDDEPDMLNMLQLLLRKQCGCEVMVAGSGSVALELLAQRRPEVIVTDIKMPDLDGLELLQRIRDFDADIAVIVMTGYGTIEMAVQALKDGAYDFLQKPFDNDRLLRVVRHCLERASLLKTNRMLQERLRSMSAQEGLIGQSPPLRQALELISRVAATDATVLIQGQSGTGKELAARTLHAMSTRSDRAMVTVNCPALPEQILESELFGYVKGAFTGAVREKKGLFQEASGSTILLDEIGDIPVSVQTKLLRVLQEKELQPLGQNRTIKVDVRVIASTNQDLEEKIRCGEFREDLFYRLNVITIRMPSLDEIRDDLPLLINHYLSRFRSQYDRPGLRLSPELLQHLYQRPWPGNVRELRNYLERLVLLAPTEVVSLTEAGLQTAADREGSPRGDDLCGLPYNQAKEESLRRFNRRYLENLLWRHRGNVTRAAASCGLERQGLQRIMRRYGILSAGFKNGSDPGTAT